MVLLISLSSQYLGKRVGCSAGPWISLSRGVALATQRCGSSSSTFPPSSSSLSSNNQAENGSGKNVGGNGRGGGAAQDMAASDPMNPSSPSINPSSNSEKRTGKSEKMSITIRSTPARPHTWQIPPQSRIAPTSSGATTSGGFHPPSPSGSPANEGSFPPPFGVVQEFKPFVEPVKRIIFIRTGLSEANEDVNRYIETPDWSIPLLEEGKRQSTQAGRKLASIVGEDPVYFYFSPYIRSRQTLRYVLEGFDEETRSRNSQCYPWWEAPEGTTSCSCEKSSSSSSSSTTTTTPTLTTSSSSFPTESNHGISSERGVCGGVVEKSAEDAPLAPRGTPGCRIAGMSEDVRLRDGDIGRYKTASEFIFHLKEAEAYGRFFYRFPFGESGADVCDRVTSFLDAFQRERVRLPMDTNVVIITHGLTLQMLIKRWFHLTVDTFHKMRPPPSGSISILTRLHHQSCYRLNENSLEMMQLPFSLNEHNGYKYRNKRLLGSMSSGAPYM